MRIPPRPTTTHITRLEDTKKKTTDIKVRRPSSAKPVFNEAVEKKEEPEEL